jgi:hypothetical protein
VAAEDELMLPQVPEAKPEDPEDVSWALSTAEAMWARGDHLEGIKWVRRAAEAASEAEDDSRALELAKAAADLASLLARKSKSEVHDSEKALPPPPASSKPRPSNQPPSHAPATARSVSARPAPPSSSNAPPPHSASNAPPPLPGKGRSVPPAPVALPSKASSPPAAPRPAAIAQAAPVRGPAPGRGILSNRTAPEPDKKKGKRRSRENLDAEAREASPNSAKTIQLTAEMKKAADSDATVVGRLEDVLANAKTGERRMRSAEEWDSSPTANLVGADDIEEKRSEPERKTYVGAAPSAAPPRPPSSTLHDPQIQTSQAIRVVVWRDAQGVHIAPAGTVVSALTIDAVLVALDPTADLTAWLSHRDR